MKTAALTNNRPLDLTGIMQYGFINGTESPTCNGNKPVSLVFLCHKLRVGAVNKAVMPNKREGLHALFHTHATSN